MPTLSRLVPEDYLAANHLWPREIYRSRTDGLVPDRCRGGSASVRFGETTVTKSIRIVNDPSCPTFKAGHWKASIIAPRLGAPFYVQLLIRLCLPADGPGEPGETMAV